MTGYRIRKLARRLLSAWPRIPIRVPSYQQIEAEIGRLPAAVIPRVLHQIWLGANRPPFETMASCRESNPGWHYVLWTEDNLPPMHNRKLFDALGTVYHGKADVLRYEVLFRFGGVYVDADQLCFRGFNDLMGPDDTFFAGYQHFGNPEVGDEERGAMLVANAVLGASPRNPIIERIIRDIRDIREMPRDLHGRVWRMVGPAALTKAIENTPSRAVIHPFHEFYPYHFTEDIPADADDMLKAIHYRSHSVSLWGTTLGRYGRFRRLPGLTAGQLDRHREVPADFVASHPRLKTTVYHG